MSRGRASGAEVGPGSQAAPSLSLISPAVMLSPNAMKLVAPRTGGVDGGASVTTNEQAAVRGGVAASVPLHVTVVGPSGKDVPAPGVHVTVTGSRPPVCVGAA